MVTKRKTAIVNIAQPPAAVAADIIAAVGITRARQIAREIDRQYRAHIATRTRGVWIPGVGIRWVKPPKAEG